MGIKQLFQIIKDEAPDAIKEGDIKTHFGRKVAIVSLAFDGSDFTLLLWLTGARMRRKRHSISGPKREPAREIGANRGTGP